MTLSEENSVLNIQDIISFISEFLSEETKLLFKQPPLSYEKLRKTLALEIGEKGLDKKQFFCEIDKYINYSVNTNHSQFYNQLFSGRNLPAVIGDILTSFLNTTVTTFEASPVLTLIEETLISKMINLVGFSKGEGIFVSGGSYANMVAVLCARYKNTPQINRQGLSKCNNLVMFISDKAHYSVINAGLIAGIGLNNIIKIKTDSQERIIISNLEKQIKMSIQNKKRPFLLVATAGTSHLGVFDDINSFARLAKHYNLWLHIDACFGGAVVLSSAYKHLLDGCNNADSIAWDAHKVMCVPLVCSAFLVKEPKWLSLICDTSSAGYILHAENYSHDIGQKTLQCGRRADALKLWLAWKYLGDEGYDSIITKNLNLAKYAAEFVKSNFCLELFMDPQSFIVCFRYKDTYPFNTNLFNKFLRKQLFRKGKCFVNYTEIKGCIYLRLAIVNPDLTRDDIDNFFNYVIEEAKVILKS